MAKLYLQTERPVEKIVLFGQLVSPDTFCSSSIIFGKKVNTFKKNIYKNIHFYLQYTWTVHLILHIYINKKRPVSFTLAHEYHSDLRQMSIIMLVVERAVTVCSQVSASSADLLVASGTMNYSRHMSHVPIYDSKDFDAGISAGDSSTCTTGLDWSRGSSDTLDSGWVQVVSWFRWLKYRGRINKYISKTGTHNDWKMRCWLFLYFFTLCDTEWTFKSQGHIHESQNKALVSLCKGK